MRERHITAEIASLVMDRSGVPGRPNEEFGRLKQELEHFGNVGRRSRRYVAPPPRTSAQHLPGRIEIVLPGAYPELDDLPICVGASKPGISQHFPLQDDDQPCATQDDDAFSFLDLQTPDLQSFIEEWLEFDTARPPREITALARIKDRGLIELDDTWMHRRREADLITLELVLPAPTYILRVLVERAGFTISRDTPYAHAVRQLEDYFGVGELDFRGYLPGERRSDFLGNVDAFETLHEMGLVHGQRVEIRSRLSPWPAKIKC